MIERVRIGVTTAVVSQVDSGVDLDDPVGSFVNGLASLIALVLVTVLLVITVVGIAVALPLVLLAYVAWAVGGAIAYLAIADRLVDHEAGWLETARRRSGHQRTAGGDWRRRPHLAL